MKSQEVLSQLAKEGIIKTNVVSYSQFNSLPPEQRCSNSGGYFEIVDQDIPYEEVSTAIQLKSLSHIKTIKYVVVGYACLSILSVILVFVSLIK